VAVVQPYWAPYAGYFRLFAAADVVVMFDCVQFPRRGYVHRYQDKGKWVTLPLRKAPRDTPICAMMLGNGADLTDYVCAAIWTNIHELNIVKPMPRSSAMNLDPDLHGEGRVVEICRRLGATHYVNPSGGRALYDHETFAKAGIELGFLKPYEGSYESILPRLLTEDPVAIREEIIRETVILP
jgi:hypothetical protein